MNSISECSFKVEPDALYDYFSVTVPSCSGDKDFIPISIRPTPTS
jgi:hypothetical protein